MKYQGALPRFVRELMGFCDPKLIGSRAQGTSHEGSDWDVIVPHGQWYRVRRAIRGQYLVSATLFGGLRVRYAGWSVDVFCCSVEELALALDRQYFPHRVIDLNTGTSFLIEKGGQS